MNKIKQIKKDYMILKKLLIPNFKAMRLVKIQPKQ